MKAVSSLLVLYWCLPYAVALQTPSKTELSPLMIQKLVDSRQKAVEELRRFPDHAFPEIAAMLSVAKAPIAIMRISKAIREKNGTYTLRLDVERTLRGKLPETLAVQSAWHEGMWLWWPPFGWDRIKPEPGKRVLAGFNVERWQVSNPRTLDLSNPEEARWLPDIEEFLHIESLAGDANATPYLNALLNRSWLVRFLALERLLSLNACKADPSCEKKILASIRHELASPNPNDRMFAVNGLRLMVEALAGAWRRSRGPHFQAKPVRTLLQLAVADKNVFVGDLAFLYLAKLDFDGKENAGYCAVITPALRKIERVPDIEKRPIGGPLNVALACVLPLRR
jgi:hypothetical protein